MEGHQYQFDSNSPQEESELNPETSTPLNLLPEERRELLRQQLQGLQPNPPQVYLDTGGRPLHSGLAAIPPLPSLPSQGFSTRKNNRILHQASKLTRIFQTTIKTSLIAGCQVEIEPLFRKLPLNH